MAEKVASQRLGEKVLAAIPTTWLDPLLTGPKAVVKVPATCPDIERLLRAIKARVEQIVAADNAGGAP